MLLLVLYMASKRKSAGEAKSAKKEIEKGKVLAALSYLWIVGLIVLLTEKKNKFVIFHAKQGTGLFIIELVLNILWAIPFIWFLSGLWVAISIALTLVAVYGIVTALQGNQVKIPVINDVGESVNKFIENLKSNK